MRHWKRDFSSHSNYVQSIEKNRQCFSKIIGLTDQRPVVQLQITTDVSGRNAPQAQLAQGRGHQIFAVRWTVIKGVEAEGLLLQPDRDPRADVVSADFLAQRLKEEIQETQDPQRLAQQYTKREESGHHRARLKLNMYTQNLYPRIYEAVQSLEVGEVGGPIKVKVEEGYSVFRVEERKRETYPTMTIPSGGPGG